MRRDAEGFQSLSPYGAPPEDEDASRRHAGGHSGARVEIVPPEPRPRSVGETLDLALEIFRARFAVLVGLSMLLWAPVRLAQPLIGLHRWTMASPDELPVGAVFGVFFSLLASATVAVLVNALASLFVAAHLADRALPIRAAFVGVLSRSFPVVVIAFLSGILTAGGAILCCAPGVFLAFKLYLAPPVCIIEGAGIRESFSRSFDLCRGRFLPWLALVVVQFLLAVPLTSVTSIADDPTLRDLFLRKLGTSSAVFDWVAVAFTSLFMGLASAFQGVVVAVWYFDCRARREGLDLETRLGRLRERRVETESAP